MFFQHLDIHDGLSNLAVSSIVQDYRGYLWFGTQNGLDRYDGRQVKVYEHNPYDRESLPHNKIQTMIAYKNSLLIGTYRGLSIFNLDTEKFRNFAKRPGSKNCLSSDVVVAILPDTDGTIWVGTLQGLNRLNLETGKSEHFFHDETNPSSLSNDVIRSLYMDSQQRIWIGTYYGLDLYDRETKSFIHYGMSGEKGYSLPSRYVMSITGGEEEDRLWLGTWDGGISLFNVKTGAVTTYPLEDNRVYLINSSQNGKIWAGTWGGGLYIFNKETEKIEKYVSESGNSTSLSHNTVYAMYRDNAGLFWIGTNGGGVNKVDPEKKHELFLYHDDNNPDSLTSGNVYAIYEDTSGYIWVGSSGGLDRWDRKNKVLKHYKHKDKKGLPNDTVTGIIEDSSGNLLIGTLKGLVVYDYTLDSFYPFITNQKDNSLNTERLYALFKDSEQNLWIGTYDSGCYMYSKRSDTYEHFIHDLDDDGSLSGNLVTSFLETGKGVWIGTSGGLNRYLPEQKKFIHYYLNPDDKTSISSNSIQTLFLDSKGRMWIGTDGGGLDLYNEKENIFSHYLKADGLSDNRIQGILEDKQGRIWCATMSGISILDPETGEINILSESDGLLDKSLNYGVLRDSEGYLYFSSSKGISRFSGKSNKHNKHTPPVYITSISSVGEKMDVTESLTIKYTRNALTFGYIGLDYVNPYGNRYSYILEGFDDDWIDAGNKIIARYSSLPSGNYTFKVKAANSDGVWGDKAAVVKIHIKPPLWRTWWAQIIYDLAVVIMIYIIIKIRSHYLLKKKITDLEVLREELLTANKRLKEVSVKDALTGLYNRRELDDRIELEVKRARRFKTPLSVFMVDIDYFKDFNDRYGHLEGDICLIKVSKTLTECLSRDSDFIARYGGEEFCIILSDCELSEAKRIGEVIKRSMQKKRIEHKKTGIGGIVTISIGISSGIPDRNSSSESFIKLADKALYQAKHKGRNRVIALKIPAV